MYEENEHIEELVQKLALPKYADAAAYLARVYDEFMHTKCEENNMGELPRQAANKIIEKNGKHLLSYLYAYVISGMGGCLSNGVICEKCNDNIPSSSSEQAEKEYILAAAPEAKALFSDMTIGVKGKMELIERFAFFTRYLYSCIFDADQLAKNRSVNNSSERKTKGNFAAALYITDRLLSDISSEMPVKKARSQLWEQAFSSIDTDGEIYLLNLPSGRGKTLCSIKLALERALKAGKKRMIYVIPDRASPEHTSEQLRDIFGDILPVNDLNGNYDSTLIVTTNIRFTQTFYQSEGSKLRMLHNFAESVIVLDEPQMMPAEFIEPSLRGIAYTVKFLESEAIILSSCLPDLKERLKNYSLELKIRELITDRSVNKAFPKYTLEYLGIIDKAVLCSEAAKHKRSLITVNSPRTAEELYKNAAEKGRKVFCLTDRLTAKEHLEKLAEIRACIPENEPMTVITAALSEWGADLDLDAVFRELSGLDSILLSAGSCNCEGRRVCGKMYVFGISEEKYTLGAEKCRQMLLNGNDITSPETISEYFRAALSNEEGRKISISEKVNSIESIPFKSFAEGYFINE